MERVKGNKATMELRSGSQTILGYVWERSDPGELNRSYLCVNLKEGKKKATSRCCSIFTKSLIFGNIASSRIGNLDTIRRRDTLASIAKFDFMISKVKERR